MPSRRTNGLEEIPRAVALGIRGLGGAYILGAAERQRTLRSIGKATVAESSADSAHGLA